MNIPVLLQYAAFLVVAALLVGTALIVGGLSYFPALALGPIIEHFLMGG